MCCSYRDIKYLHLASDSVHFHCFLFTIAFNQFSFVDCGVLLVVGDMNSKLDLLAGVVSLLKST